MSSGFVQGFKDGVASVMGGVWRLIFAIKETAAAQRQLGFLRATDVSSQGPWSLAYLLTIQVLDTVLSSGFLLGVVIVVALASWVG